MILALIYGAFELFYQPAQTVRPEQEAQEDVQAAQELAQKISQETAVSALSEEQVHILQRIAVDWDRNPFYVHPEQKKSAKKPKRQRVDLGPLEYTGFLEMNQKRMAIINGMEYKVDEMLEEGNAVLRAIEPGHILLETSPGGQKITIPYKSQ